MASTIVTPTLLTSLRQTPYLPPSTYYLLAATALSTLNLPHEIPNVFSHAITHGPSSKDTKPTLAEQLSIARRTREALVKSSAIIGLPKTINALFSLKAATPKNLIDDPLGFNPSGRAIDLYNRPPSVVMARGAKFFETVYGKVTGRKSSPSSGSVYYERTEACLHCNGWRTHLSYFDPSADRTQG